MTSYPGVPRLRRRCMYYPSGDAHSLVVKGVARVASWGGFDSTADYAGRKRFIARGSDEDYLDLTGSSSLGNASRSQITPLQPIATYTSGTRPRSGEFSFTEPHAKQYAYVPAPLVSTPLTTAQFSQPEVPSSPDRKQVTFNPNQAWMLPAGMESTRGRTERRAQQDVRTRSAERPGSVLNRARAFVADQKEQRNSVRDRARSRERLQEPSAAAVMATPPADALAPRAPQPFTPFRSGGVAGTQKPDASREKAASLQSSRVMEAAQMAPKTAVLPVSSRLQQAIQPQSLHTARQHHAQHQVPAPAAQSHGHAQRTQQPHHFQATGSHHQPNFPHPQQSSLNATSVHPEQHPRYEPSRRATQPPSTADVTLLSQTPGQTVVSRQATSAKQPSKVSQLSSRFVTAESRSNSSESACSSALQTPTQLVTTTTGHAPVHNSVAAMSHSNAARAGAATTTSSTSRAPMNTIDLLPSDAMATDPRLSAAPALDQFVNSVMALTSAASNPLDDLVNLGSNNWGSTYSSQGGKPNQQLTRKSREDLSSSQRQKTPSYVNKAPAPLLQPSSTAAGVLYASTSAPVTWQCSSTSTTTVTALPTSATSTSVLKKSPAVSERFSTTASRLVSLRSPPRSPKKEAVPSWTTGTSVSTRRSQLTTQRGFDAESTSDSHTENKAEHKPHPKSKIQEKSDSRDHKSAVAETTSPAVKQQTATESQHTKAKQLLSTPKQQLVAVAKESSATKQLHVEKQSLTSTLSPRTVAKQQTKRQSLESNQVVEQLAVEKSTTKHTKQLENATKKSASSKIDVKKQLLKVDSFNREDSPDVEPMALPKESVIIRNRQRTDSTSSTDSMDFRSPKSSPRAPRRARRSDSKRRSGSESEGCAGVDLLNAVAKYKKQLSIHNVKNYSKKESPSLSRTESRDDDKLLDKPPLPPQKRDCSRVASPSKSSKTDDEVQTCNLQANSTDNLETDTAEESFKSAYNSLKEKVNSITPLSDDKTKAEPDESVITTAANLISTLIPNIITIPPDLVPQPSLSEPSTPAPSGGGQLRATVRTPRRRSDDLQPSPESHDTRRSRSHERKTSTESNIVPWRHRKSVVTSIESTKPLNNPAQDSNQPIECDDIARSEASKQSVEKNVNDPPAETPNANSQSDIQPVEETQAITHPKLLDASAAMSPGQSVQSQTDSHQWEMYQNVLKAQAQKLVQEQKRSTERTVSIQAGQPSLGVAKIRHVALQCVREKQPKVTSHTEMQTSPLPDKPTSRFEQLKTQSRVRQWHDVSVQTSDAPQRRKKMGCHYVQTDKIESVETRPTFTQTRATPTSNVAVQLNFSSNDVTADKCLFDSSVQTDAFHGKHRGVQATQVTQNDLPKETHKAAKPQPVGVVATQTPQEPEKRTNSSQTKKPLMISQAVETDRTPDPNTFLFKDTNIALRKKPQLSVGTDVTTQTDFYEKMKRQYESGVQVDLTKVPQRHQRTQAELRPETQSELQQTDTKTLLDTGIQATKKGRDKGAQTIKYDDDSGVSSVVEENGRRRGKFNIHYVQTDPIFPQTIDKYVQSDKAVSFGRGVQVLTWELPPVDYDLPTVDSCTQCDPVDVKVESVQAGSGCTRIQDIGVQVKITTLEDAKSQKYQRQVTTKQTFSTGTNTTSSFFRTMEWGVNTDAVYFCSQLCQTDPPKVVEAKIQTIEFEPDVGHAKTQTTSSMSEEVTRMTQTLRLRTKDATQSTDDLISLTETPSQTNCTTIVRRNVCLQTALPSRTVGIQCNQSRILGVSLRENVAIQVTLLGGASRNVDCQTSPSLLPAVTSSTQSSQVSTPYQQRPQEPDNASLFQLSGVLDRPPAGGVRTTDDIAERGVKVALTEAAELALEKQNLYRSLTMPDLAFTLEYPAAAGKDEDLEDSPVFGTRERCSVDVRTVSTQTRAPQSMNSLKRTRSENRGKERSSAAPGSRILDKTKGPSKSMVNRQTQTFVRHSEIGIQTNIFEKMVQETKQSPLSRLAQVIHRTRKGYRDDKAEQLQMVMFELESLQNQVAELQDKCSALRDHREMLAKELTHHRERTDVLERDISLAVGIYEAELRGRDRMVWDLSLNSRELYEDSMIFHRKNLILPRNELPDEEDLDEEDRLGEGLFGNVYRFHYRGNNTALKVFSAKVYVKEQGVREEASALLALQGSGVAPTLLGVCMDRMPYMLMQTFHGMNGQSTTVDFVLRHQHLFDYIKKSFWYAVLRNTAEALNQFHLRGMIHGDIKADNIAIVDITGRIVLLDMGIAKPYCICESFRHMGKWGEQSHTPLEVFCGDEQRSPASDVYAFGILVERVMKKMNYKKDDRLVTVATQCKGPADHRPSPYRIKHILSNHK